MDEIQVPAQLVIDRPAENAGRGAGRAYRDTRGAEHDAPTAGEWG